MELLSNIPKLIYLVYYKLSIDNIAYSLFLIRFTICGLGGLLITLSHSFFSYSWLRNNFNIYVGIILPIIGLTITTVIGSNIALSLGMIGALSIVRFRTPVRSPYELILYFSLLTVGIAAKVSLTITIILIIVLTLLPFIISKTSNWIEFSKNNIKEKKQVFLNFEGKINLIDLSKLEQENSIKNYSITKENDGILFIKAFAYFDNLEKKNIFLNEWKNSIISFEVSKEELNAHQN